MNARQLVLGLALAGTLAATWWMATQEQELAENAAPGRPAGGTAARGREEAAESASRTAIETTDDRSRTRYAGLVVVRDPWPEVGDELVRRVNFNPPPPPASEMKPPAPMAPPLPFRFVGAIDDAQGKAVFLLEGNQVRLVREGDKLSGQYRLDRIAPTAIEFTYLPLDMKQTLSRQSP